MGTRDTLSCKDCHQPTGPHGHVSGPLVKFELVQCLFPHGTMTFKSNRLLGLETRPCVQSESHSYSRHNLHYIECFYIHLYSSNVEKNHFTYNIICLRTHFLLQLQLQVTFLRMKILANKFCSRI